MQVSMPIYRQSACIILAALLLNIQGCALPTANSRYTQHQTDTSMSADDTAVGSRPVLPRAFVTTIPPDWRSPLDDISIDKAVPPAQPYHTTFYYPQPKDHRAVSSKKGMSSDRQLIKNAMEVPQTVAPAASEHPTPAGPANLWARIRRLYGLGNAAPGDKSRQRRITAQRNWYVAHPSYLERTVDRARPYLYLIVAAVEARGMPTEMALLPIVESAYQPFAYSHGRAAGIWQFIPGTARHFGLKQNWWYDGRRDIAASTRAALDYLQSLHKSFSGDWLLALAAYNSGSGTVRAAIRYNRKRGRPTDFWSLRLPNETRDYVPRLLAISEIIAKPQRFNISLAPIPDTPHLTSVNIGSQIDLALAADLAGLSLDEIYLLNPGYNRWATDPEGPHRLLLPVNVADKFIRKLQTVPASQRIHWIRHRIRSGETLGHIANRYGTTVNVLRQVNKIRGHMIRAGKSMIIPVATRDLRRYKLSVAQRRKSIQNSIRKGARITHIVNPGDTWWDLARKYHVGTRQLAKWNGMAPRDFLRPGQKLVIWQGKAQRKAMAVDYSLGLSPAMNKITRRIRYTVRQGDSLARISQRFRVTVSELRRWNSLRRGKYLQPGQRLTLYVNVTRQTENI